MYTETFFSSLHSGHLSFPIADPTIGDAKDCWDQKKSFFRLNRVSVQFRLELPDAVRAVGVFTVRCTLRFGAYVKAHTMRHAFRFLHREQSPSPFCGGPCSCETCATLDVVSLSDTQSALEN